MYMLVVLVGMFAIFYFLMIRPQRQRQKDHQNFIEALKKGDMVITAGGICGEIDEVNALDVILEVEDGMKLKLLKSSIVARQQGESDEDFEEEDDIEEAEEAEDIKEIE